MGLTNFFGNRRLRTALCCPAILLLLIVFDSFGQIGDYASHTTSGRSVVITGSAGESIRITPYGDYIVRIQTVRKDESFFSDDRYEMVVRHDWDGTCTVDSNASSLTIATSAADGISILVTKSPLRLSFSIKPGNQPVLVEKDGTVWSGNTITETFTAATDEHFAGLGHEKYGRIEKLDRSGTSLKVSTGAEGACIVPFYLSSKGYGVFLNTTFTHTITLCKSNVYSLAIDDEGVGGRMDYFFIAGPGLTQVIDRYTQLTGRPRLPQRSIFGLHLSDKSDPNNNGEPWWKDMIAKHRNAGFAFDHQVNDNAWRASNEATSGQKNSWFEFRKDRFPDPAEYKRWCDANGITVTLDLNRPGIPLNKSWVNSLSIPGVTDCPDFTNPAARKWIWDLFYNFAFKPSLGYPGDAIWLDEFDYPDHNHSTTLSSGKKWAEEAINYHLNLQKACVQEGWDPAIGEAKRPYFWSRGITAGAQRWGHHWSGDIDGNWNDMKYQVKAMQSSGVSGFPYFNHDAGGHVNLTNNGDNSYRQWDMGFGSFTPIWKPHGPSHSRWPLQRNSTCQGTAKTFITTRYQMIPYIYTYAYIAHATGVPMVRSMFLEDRDNATAWQKEMQYYWGKELLVAPNCSDGNNNVSVWFPSGNWYDFWNDQKYAGNTTVNYSAATGVVPVFAKEGAIIPMAPFAKSTFFIPKDTIVIHVYTGVNGSFQLYDDDGVTEKFRTKNEFRTTEIRYTQEDLGLQVQASNGSYSGAPTRRTYSIVYHGLTASAALYYNTSAITSYSRLTDIPANQNGAVWDTDKKLLNVQIASQPIDNTFKVANVQTRVLGRDLNRLSVNAMRMYPDRIVVDCAAGSGEVRLSIHRLSGSTVHSFSKPSYSTGSYRVFSLRSLALGKGTYLVQFKTNTTELVRHVVLR
jgi:alpha-glucosidase (family GH31 glycosyl hydrolase)